MKNKTVIITGASSGIGKATAELFAKEGAYVTISDTRDKEGMRAAEDIRRSGGNATFFKADASRPEDMKALVDFAVRTYGKLDIAVNNAGMGGESNIVADMSIEGWQLMMNVNLSSVFYGMKYQIPAMILNEGGSIVNVSSMPGSAGFSTSAGYAAAKHGILGLSQAAAMEYSDKNIRINAIGPGFIDSPLLGGLNDEMKRMITGMQPGGRMGKAEEVAELIFWLGNENASFLTGSYYPVDGAYLAR